MARGQWVYAPAGSSQRLSDQQKQEITAACERLIAEVFIPRHLPKIGPTKEFNYPIAIHGKWHGSTYRFIQRYRSPFKEAAADPEFDAPFARLEFVSRNCFDLSWFRHTGRWHTLHRSVTFDEAMRLLREDELLHPV